MSFSLPFLNPLFRWITHRIRFFMVVAGILWCAFIAWQSWEQWFDAPLPAERVTARQLRVNESLRQTLLKDISSATSATTPKTVPSITGITPSER